MLKNKLLRRGCLSLVLLLLVGVIGIWGFVGLRTAKLTRFADDNREAVERVGAMVTRAARPADETTATTQTTPLPRTPAAPARADKPTTPGELAAQLWQIERAANYNELRESPLTRNQGEVGLVTLGLPASAKFFASGADGRLAPTAEAWRIIHEEVALAEGGWQYIRSNPMVPHLKASLKSPATTASVTVSSTTTTTVTAATAIEKPLPRIEAALDLAARLIDRPEPLLPDAENRQELPHYRFAQLAPAAIWRTDQREGAEAAARQFENFLCLRQVIDLHEFPQRGIMLYSQEPVLRLLAQLGAEDRLDTPTLAHLARRLDGLRLSERQLTDLRQAHVARLRPWLDGIFDGSLVGERAQPMNGLQRGARQAMISFFRAYMQRGALAWARGDEAEFYDALAEFDRGNNTWRYQHTIGGLKYVFYEIMTRAFPPELGAWNGEGAINENTDLTRLLLAAIRFRRERGREPVSLAELTPAYLTGPEWRGTADSVWAVERPGSTTVPLIPSPASPAEASSFTQAVVHYRQAERATPRSAEQLRRTAASPAEAQGFGEHFAPVPGRTLLCHFRRVRLHRKEFLGFEGMNSLVTDYHLPWNRLQVPEILGPLADLGEIENPLRAGTEQVDTIAITVLWPQPELIDGAQVELTDR